MRFRQSLYSTTGFPLLIIQIDPLYIAEVSPAAHRGELVTWSEMAINVGIVLGFFSGVVFYDVNDNLEWRLMFAMGCILPVAMIILSRTVMVESPRWLVSKGQEEAAKEILRRVYPHGFDVDPVAQDIKEALERERIAEQNVGWNIILFPTKAIRRMLIVGVGTAVAQQAVGIDAIQYYLMDVLDQSGIKSEKAQLGVLMLLGVLKLLFVVVGSKLLDRSGRRPLFFVSLVGEYFSLLQHILVVMILNYILVIIPRYVWCLYSDKLFFLWGEKQLDICYCGTFVIPLLLQCGNGSWRVASSI
jgi:MFS family permease